MAGLQGHLLSRLLIVLIGLLAVTGSTVDVTDKDAQDNATDSHGIEVAHINFANVREPLVFTVVVIFAALCKVAFHHTNFLSSKVPESCLLIILGVVCGAIVEYSGGADHLPEFFSPHDFFQFLLPPIILEASFSLHDRTFAENIGSILLYAVVGTVLAFCTLGFTMYGLAIAGAMGSFPFHMSLTQVLIYAALIVAVDPVAVLAVFQEIGVNNVLYFLVFGESLLNDGVTVVLYQVMQSYDELSLSGEGVDGQQLGLGILKFLVVCAGGLGLGILAGALTAFFTKYTRHVKVVQPILIYTMAYLGFLMAELFEFSGIIAIIGCGLTQVQYAFHNISDKSRTTIVYFTKVISTTNEIIIFLFLGLAMVRKRSHMWHTGFVLWSVILCLLYRFIITYFLTFLVNTLDKSRNRKIGYDEQFMMAYGGLRGAVAFSLVALLDEDKLPTGMKDMFETATLVVIFFTVFIQGISIKPLVKLLRIKLAPSKELSLNADLNENLTDHVMAGIEEIVGIHGRFTLKEEFENFEDRYIKRFLQLEPETSHTQLQEFYNKIILKEHFKHLELAGAKVDPGRTHIPRIDTKMYLYKEDEHSHVPHGHVAEPVVRKKRKHKLLHIDHHGLRSLLKTHRGASALHRKWDKNLTEEHHGNIANQIQTKTTRNRQLQNYQLNSSKNPESEDEARFDENGSNIRKTGRDIEARGAGCEDIGNDFKKTGSESQEYDNPVYEGEKLTVHFEYSGGADHLPEFFSPHDFFQFLLPPIILEASFSLHDRTFAENIGSILLYAVVGTVLAFCTIGFTMYGLAIAGAMGSFPFHMSLTQVLIFAALIVAVDPVAVLAVFQEIGVNNVLYFLVFGESLLNDGVTVVLYQVMQSYDELSSSGEGVDGEQLGLGILKFLVVCAGGLGLGILAGALTAFFTKYTRHVKVVQPILIYTMAYLGFLLAELFEFSGIIAIIGCGLTQVQYAFHNISDKSRTTIVYFTKVISTTNEIIIFLFLGLAMVRKRSHMWHTGFVLWSVILCLLYRFIITFFLTFLVNTLDKSRNRKIGYDEQFMMAYGGLRGAVAFSLVALLDEDKLPTGMKDMFETATLVVIFFTVFIQGISIKPLVKLLRIKLAPSKELSLNADLNENLTDHVMAGIEEIVGIHGRFTLKEEFENFEDRYIKRFLQLEPETSHTQLQEFYNKIILKEHFKHLEIAGAKVDPGRTHIPRIDTKMYLYKEDEHSHVPHGHVAEPEVRKKRKHKLLHIDHHGLRSLLKTHRGASALHRKWDKNLTEEHHGNIANQIQTKTTRNRQLQKYQFDSSKNPESEDEARFDENGSNIRKTGRDIEARGAGCEDIGNDFKKTGSESQEYDNPVYEGEKLTVHFE